MPLVVRLAAWFAVALLGIDDKRHPTLRTSAFAEPTEAVAAFTADLINSARGPAHLRVPNKREEHQSEQANCAVDERHPNERVLTISECLGRCDLCPIDR